MSATIAINDGDTHNGPSEQVEAKYPLLVERYGLRQDSGGAGKFRGGLGCEQVVRVLSEISFNAQVDRVECRPWGLFGGLSGYGNEVALTKNSIETPFATGKVLSQKLKQGDVYCLRSGGGGGFGSPLDRATSDVESDVRQGYVSRAAAEEQYGVVIDPSTGRADAEATQELRARMRRLGLPKDRPFTSQDRNRSTPHCVPEPDPEAHELDLEAHASGLTRWRCC